MIYKVKSLITAAQELEVNVIGHQANCFCLMGSGIAPLIAAAFPDAEKADNETFAGNRNKLGDFTVGEHLVVGALEEEYIQIYNLYGQYGYGREKVDTNYIALRHAIRRMAQNLDPHYARIGLPKLGCGLGGGDWAIVSEIIEDELDNFDVTIYVLDESEIPTS